MKQYRFILLGLLLVVGAAGSLSAGKWTTHFAYNNVTQIAMSPDKVYAVSDGNLYSVNKTTEEIEVYSRQSGLHGTGITCIHYDELGEQLIICYSTGKIDILSSNGVQYVGGLYDKDMTQRKTIYNVTISGRTAYLSTHYGVQTMDLRENKMVDSYWLRPGGLETPVKDVKLTSDSIYAFTDDSLFSASRQDNIVDYTVWKRELRNGRISPDADKGKHYQDVNSHWYSGNTEGIIRYTATDRLTYKPNGPIVNTPYRLRCGGNRLGMIQGGYDAGFYNRPAIIMILDNDSWVNIDNQYIRSHTGTKKFNDISDIIFDPQDLEHFFVSSFGYGLMEFREDTFYYHYNPSNSAIEPTIPASYPYIWVDGLTTDTIGNLWMLNNCANGIKILQQDGNWVSISNAACMDLSRSKDLLISVKNPNIKFVSSIDNGIGVFDDNGTISDQTDDRAILCSNFMDENGRTFAMVNVTHILQAPNGTLLIGTRNGLYRIDNPEGILDGNINCFHVDVSEGNRTNIFESENIRSIERNSSSQIWVGTQTSGLYLLSADLTQVLEHYSSDNSSLPSNDILSLCWMDSKQCLFIGTSEGLVEYEPDKSGEGITGLREEDQSKLDPGDMLQWKLHFSYHDAQEVAASPSHVYALTQGSIFSVDRADDSMKQWSKANGLNGSTISHIAYDARSGKLIIGYADGRIDLLSDDGTVEQMPDIYMKAGSVAVTINSIYTGSKYVYLAMSFGIVAIDPSKAEVTDTYYIGSNAASVEVQQIVETGDSLYAYSYDRLYRASKKDNLVDYSFWKSSLIPLEKVQHAVVYNGHLYALDNDSSLYRNNGSAWSRVTSKRLLWAHVSGNQFLTYEPGVGLLRMDENEQFTGLTDRYAAQDAIYSNGEYWLAEEGKGLVKLSSAGDIFFRPEGPMNNFGYNLQIAHNQVYVSPGGRWATMFGRQSSLSIYDGLQWRGIPWSDTWYYTNHDIRDVVRYAVDANDPSHFYVSTYSTGVFEFKDYKAVNHYDSANSTLRKYDDTVDDYFYTCTDGAMMDEQGNLWVMNSTSSGRPLHILTPSGQWYGLRLRSEGTDLRFTTPGAIWTDRRDSRYKWMMDQRHTQGVVFFYDGGTPTNNSDDKCLKRNIFVDQNGNTLSPSFFFCLTQDLKNRTWIGTDKGIILIPSETDFFKSNACRRIIIPRNDGTGLGDYLLGDEQIKCMAVDGGNRMWIGTANSGVYVIEDDTITVSHFTVNNSLLPSNSIQSIAIVPSTGEVFVGTDKGIASYRADASEPAKDHSKAYAYPNPVRPDYGGYITITGLMENTAVNIVDGGGNLVCKTKSHGGTAVWDGKLPDGRRATAGVYTALCNSSSGKAVVKILVIR